MEVALLDHAPGCSWGEQRARFAPDLVVFSRTPAPTGLKRFQALRRIRELYTPTATLLQVSNLASGPYRSPLIALAEASVDATIALADRLCPEAPLQALHVRETGEALVRETRGTSLSRMAEIELQLRRESREALEEAIEAASSTRELELQIGAGDPVDVILEEVERQHVDLLIAGPRRGPRRAKLGVPHTLEKLLLDVKCDVAVAAAG